MPVGLSDELRTSRVKVFCPKCEEVYIPKFKSINVDGAYFGTSLPHIFLKTFKEAVVLPPRIFHYEPKIQGFRLFKKTGSRAVGAKDVITYPKAYAAHEAAEELLSRQKKVAESKHLVDDETAMTNGENKENSQQDDDQNSSKKKGKTGKKSKGKGRN